MWQRGQVNAGAVNVTFSQPFVDVGGEKMMIMALHNYYLRVERFYSWLIIKVELQQSTLILAPDVNVFIIARCHCMPCMLPRLSVSRAGVSPVLSCRKNLGISKRDPEFH